MVLFTSVYNVSVPVSAITPFAIPQPDPADIPTPLPAPAPRLIPLDLATQRAGPGQSSMSSAGLEARSAIIPFHTASCRRRSSELCELLVTPNPITTYVHLSADADALLPTFAAPQRSHHQA